MLLSYSLSNFASFADRAVMSFALHQRDTVHGWSRVSPGGRRFTTAMAVMGANGAGKSSLVKASPFLAWFIRDSFRLGPDDTIPFRPHAVYANRPSEFEIEAEGVDKVSWRYVLQATPERVLHEALYRKEASPRARYTYVFDRTLKGEAYEVRQQGFGLADSEAAKVRRNVSLIAWGRQYGAPTALQVSDFLLTTNLQVEGRLPPMGEALWDAAAFFSSKEPLAQQMRRLVTRWDLGLSDFRITDLAAHDPTSDQRQRWYPFGIHDAAGQRFELPFGLESSGTQSAFVLLSRLLPVLAQGGLAFIDELENDLHPHMIEPILRLFHDESSNPHGAQVVFTCQSPEVLRLLQRCQVTFVDKTDCASRAYRGDEIEGLTSAHNLYAKYMAGALGAVPRF